MPPISSRRDFLHQAGGGAGKLALASLLGSQLAGSQLASARDHQSPHYEAKAKNVIWLFMNGGASGIDTFDEKPVLKKWHGEFFPQKVKTLFPHPGPVMQSPYKFNKHGESGQEVSEIFPEVARHVDDLCVIRSCTSTELNHTPACYVANTGVSRVGSPALGSFATYGLGTENENLPGFVVMYDHRSFPEGGANLWSSGFLPPKYQGVPFRPQGEPVLYLNRSTSEYRQNHRLNLLNKLNRLHQEKNRHNPELEARIESFETAYRMQTAVPELVDLSRESQKTLDLYGLDDPKSEPFGKRLMLARKMVENGVRFQQIYHGGWDRNWDSHGSLEKNHRELAFEIDKPIAGLLTDLKRRGLLDSTLVIWAGEFGRLPLSQNEDGRDHNPYGFTIWMAGGGVRSGFSYGQTDEFGYKAIENPVSMNDLHATILHLMGIDHEALTFFFNGREQTMTNSLGHIVKDLCA